MKNEPRRTNDRLLLWYPSSWRERYGDEFLALLDDEWGERSPSLRYRRSIIRSGLRERVHATGLVGDGGDAPARLRSGALLVLSTWTLFVLGGIEFQKASEHFAQSVPLGSRTPSIDAYNAVVLFAMISFVVVVLGAAVVLPAVVAFFRSGGFGSVRRGIYRSAVASALVVGSVLFLSWWAHGLNEFQRNGGNAAYVWAIAGFAVLVALTLASWTATVIAIVRQLTLSNRILRVEATLAILLTATMVVITVATASWWGELARHASWFLQGSPIGTTSSSPVSATMVTIVSMMSVAILCATYGVVRIAGSWRQCSPRALTPGEGGPSL